MFEKEEKEYIDGWSEEWLMKGVKIFDQPAVGLMRQWKTSSRFNLAQMCSSCIHSGFEIKYADKIEYSPKSAYKALACYEFHKSFTKEDCELIISKSHSPKWKKISAEDLLTFFNEVCEAAQRIASRSQDFVKNGQSYSTEAVIESI